MIQEGNLGVLCSLDIYEYLYELGGGNLSLLNNNPFVYRISKSQIRFGEQFYRDHPRAERSSGPDWIRWWKRFEGWKIITFSGLQNDSQN